MICHELVFLSHVFVGLTYILTKSSRWLLVESPIINNKYFNNSNSQNTHKIRMHRCVATETYSIEGDIKKVREDEGSYEKIIFCEDISY